jgi:hypothetical protein
MASFDATQTTGSDIELEKASFACLESQLIGLS